MIHFEQLPLLIHQLFSILMMQDKEMKAFAKKESGNFNLHSTHPSKITQKIRLW